MIFSDLHAHTNFCDGKNSPEEMVKSAIEKGLKRIGLVVHSYTDFDKTYCVTIDGEKAFKKEMARLKTEYKDKIEVLCGVEQDVFSTQPTDGYDYVIGSVHYFKVKENYYDVDRSEEYFLNTVNTVFNGDFFAAVENYYQAVTELKVKKPNIIGHLDLITKFNQGDKYFSTNDQRYIKASRAAVDELIGLSVPFELNVGAISRGYRQEPYPSKDLIDYIKSKGGKLIISSDSHSIDNLGYKFSEWQKLL